MLTPGKYYKINNIETLVTYVDDETIQGRITGGPNVCEKVIFSVAGIETVEILGGGYTNNNQQKDQEI